MDGNTQLIATLGVIVAAVIAAVASWLVARAQHKGAPEHRMIESLWTQLKDAQDRLTEHDQKFTELRRDMRRLEHNEVRYQMYTLQLRQWIEDGKPPPPPPWPEGLGPNR